MKKVTRWSPDHCGCSLLYEWDDTTSNEDRVHTPVEESINWEGNVEKTKRCSHHSKHDLNELHSIVIEESQRKEHIRQIFHEEFPDQSKDGFKFYYDDDRNVHIITPLDDKSKAKLLKLAEIKVGKNKAIIV